jgi:hypothetical protein
VLAKKVSNVGFEAIEIADRRPVGLDELARYPVFTEELQRFLREALPERRHAEIVWAVTLTACKPEDPKGDAHDG